METQRRFLISVALLLALVAGFYPAPSQATGTVALVDASPKEPSTGAPVPRAPRTAGPARSPRLSPDQAVAAALGSAACPEIGANDFRISFMGQDALYDAFRPAVAYNSTENEYLVVWHGDDNSGHRTMIIVIEALCEIRRCCENIDPDWNGRQEEEYGSEWNENNKGPQGFEQVHPHFGANESFFEKRKSIPV